MKNPAPRLSEINVTPLIDVLLVLLVTFLLIGPRLRRELQTALPRPAAAQDGRLVPAPPTVHVDTNGVSLNGRPLSRLAELGPGLHALWTSTPERAVFVQATGSLPYRDVVQVLDAVRSAGAQRIGMLPRPTELTD